MVGREFARCVSSWSDRGFRNTALMATSAAPRGAASNAASALRQWEDANGVMRTTDDGHFVFEKQKQDELFKDKPWKRDPKYFNRVLISAVALVKILMHAKTGKGKQGVISGDANNWIEVMGLVQGGLRDRTFVITDSFALPVDASEVECAMNDASITYMIGYQELCRDMGRPDSGLVGWYHSHPGYSCYLSGTDVATQTNYQMHQDPNIALVVDPVRSISTGKVEIKAFRTFPEGYTDPANSMSTHVNNAGELLEGVPLSKIEESGYHAHRYYEVPLTVFRSASDARILTLLWNKYWGQTLAASPLVTNRVFVDARLEVLASRLHKAEQSLSFMGFSGAFRSLAAEDPTARLKGSSERRVDPIAALARTNAAAANEVLSGLLGMLVKRSAFNDRRQ